MTHQGHLSLPTSQDNTIDPGKRKRRLWSMGYPMLCSLLGIISAFAIVLYPGGNSEALAQRTPSYEHLAYAKLDSRRGRDNRALTYVSPRRRRRHRYRRRHIRCRNMLKRKYSQTYLRKNRRLETSIRMYLRDLHRCRILLRYDRARVLVYDYRRCKLVAIRQNTRTSAASLIKPFVMFGVYYRERQRGYRAYEFPRRLQRHVNRMMRVSNNYSTNYLIRHYLGDGSARRGLNYLNKLIRRFGYTRTRFLEMIPRGGRTYRNYTSARDLSKLLFHIYRNKAVSRTFSKKMMKVMVHSRDNRGKTPYLRYQYDIRAATKTGYTRRTNGVAGIVLDGDGLRHSAVYNFVIILSRPLIRGANEWKWRRATTPIIQRISEMTYRYYLKGYARREVRRNRRTCRR